MIFAGIMVGAILLVVAQLWGFDVFEFSKPAETLREDVKAGVQDFYVGGNYDAGVAEVEQAISKAKVEGVNGDDLGYQELALSNLYVKDDPKESLALRAQIFNNSNYSKTLRDTALFDALEHVDSQFLINLTIEQVREYVFSPGAFESILPPNTPLETRSDVYAAVRYGLQKIVNENQGLRGDLRELVGNSRILLARQIFSDIEDEKDSLPKEEYRKLYYERVAEAREHIKYAQALAKANTLRESEFRPATETLFSNTFRSLGTLYWAGEVSIEDVRASYEEFVLYMDVLPDPSVLKDVALAVTGYVVAQMELYDIAKYQGLDAALSAETKARVAKQISYLVELDAVNKKRRTDIRDYPQWKDQIPYQTFVYIANNIEPRLKNVLINEIGGWTQADFSQ